jgi:hypothetical protein
MKLASNKLSGVNFKCGTETLVTVEDANESDDTDYLDAVEVETFHIAKDEQLIGCELY